MKHAIRVFSLAALSIVAALAQTPADPFPASIPAAEGVIRVGYREFAALPDIDGVPARMMNLVTEPGTRRVFVSDMRGQIYRVGEDGQAVTLYLDINAAGVPVQSMGRERGFQSFAVHPQFNEQGRPGFGKLSTRTSTRRTRHRCPTSARRQAQRKRTTRCYSSGPPSRRAPEPTTAARRAS
jgi:hypothetical protein